MKQTLRCWFVTTVIVLAGCSAASPPASSGASEQATSAAQQTMRPSATSVPTPTEVASAQYLALASRVNSEWRALGALPAVGAPLETRQRYQAEWFAIEEEVVAGLAAISWPATAATEAAALAGAASTVRTLLQPNDKSGQFLELISFTTRDQTSAATALRVTLGLPAMEVNDLL